MSSNAFAKMSKYFLTGSRNSILSLMSSKSFRDFDKTIGFWLKDVPYLWVNGDAPQESERHYFTNVDDTVYLSLDQEKQEFLPKKMYLLEFKSRDDLAKTNENPHVAYRIKTKNKKLLRLFLAYDTYSKKITMDELRYLDVRINGEKIDPIDAFVPEVRQAYGHHLHFEPIYLRYQHSIPSTIEVVRRDE